MALALTEAVMYRWASRKPAARCFSVEVGGEFLAAELAAREIGRKAFRV